MNLSKFKLLVKEAGREWIGDNATRLAAAVAFYTILSLAPLLVLAVAIAGLVFGEEAARGELVHQMRDMVGDAGAEVVQTMLANAKKPGAGIIATIIGVGTLLFGAAGVFGELHDAMNVVWDVKEKEGRGWLGLVTEKFLSFGMVLSTGFLLLVSLVLSTAVSAFAGYIGRKIPGMPVLIEIANYGITLLVITTMFAVLFRYLPDVRPPWRSVWFGAIVTALLFSLGKFLIGLYLSHAAVGTPFGAAGSLVAMVVWVYYSSLIFFFGAELTQAHVRHFGKTVETVAGAERRIPASDDRSHSSPAGVAS